MDSGIVPENRTAIRLQYGELFDVLSKLLFELDPISVNFETNTDEYEPEVGTIISRLTYAEAEADVRKIVHEEFCKWFDSKTAGPIEDYDDIASRIWIEWQQYNRRMIVYGSIGQKKNYNEQSLTRLFYSNLWNPIKCSTDCS